MGIREQLGFSASDAGWDSVTRHLQEFYLGSDREKHRRKQALLRDELYRDNGSHHLRKVISEVYGNVDVIRDRKVWADYAKFDNALKRIINELSTVYLEPARRKIAQGQDGYDRLVTQTHLDHKMRRANRITNLQNEALIWFRVRTDDRGRREPVVDVVSPHAFTVVAHPTDPTKQIATIIDQTPRRLGVKEVDPHYALWTADETVQLDGKGRVIASTFEANPYGMVPGILVHREPPETTLLDPSSGADLVAAHVAATFLNILLLKESRTINKQVAFGGDLSTTPTGQTQDQGRDMVLGDGVTAQTIDRTIDLRQFRDSADHVIERAAANYGIPPSVLRHSGANSGFEIELRRIGLRERRRDQIVNFIPVEQQLADVMSTVLAVDAPELWFDPSGWSISFGEIETYIDPRAQLQVWKDQRQMGLANTLDFIKEMNPGMGDEEALRELTQNISIETMRNVLMRPMLAAAGTLPEGAEGGGAVAEEPADPGDGQPA